MLQDAALLQLRLTSEALREGLMLKDASPYNVQWRGSRPIFIDVGLVRAFASRGAVARLSAVLHALPLPAAPRGVSRRPVQPWLSGASTGSRRGTSERCSRVEMLFGAECSTRLSSREPRESTKPEEPTCATTSRRPASTRV